MTYVVDGSLWHKDSKGNAEELGRGAIQFMSAGTGVSHSEANHGGKPLRFVQSWIVPRKHGLKPNYGSASGFDRQDKWAYMVGDAGAAGEASDTGGGVGGLCASRTWSRTVKSKNMPWRV